MNRYRVATFCLLTLMATQVIADEGEWGDLRGQFIIAGPVPAPRTIRITKDIAALGETVVDESLMVNPKNKGIANLVVYLLPNADDDLRVHASYKRTANAKVALTMQDARFKPHVLLLRTTQTMVQRNKDEVGHHAMIQFFGNPPR